MRSIAISSQKGGVGKTTTAVNLAYVLAEMGKKVLLVDCDSQANATSGLGVSVNRPKNTYTVLVGTHPLAETVVPLLPAGLFLVPSTRALAAAEVELREIPNWETILRELTADLNFDFILFDTPPSLGALTILSLASARSVLVPVQAEYLALEGLAALLETVKLIKSSLNPSLYLEGFLVTMFDRRVNLSQQVEAEVRRIFGSKVFKAVIPRSVRLAEAPSFGKPVARLAPKNLGSEAYRRLAQEICHG